LVLKRIETCFLRNSSSGRRTDIPIMRAIKSNRVEFSLSPSYPSIQAHIWTVFLYVTRYECSGVNLRPIFEHDFCVFLLSEAEAVRLQKFAGFSVIVLDTINVL